MLKSKEHKLKKNAPPLPERRTSENPLTTPIYDTMAQASNGTKGINHYNSPIEATEYLQHARNSLEKSEEIKTVKVSHHYPQRDAQTPPPPLSRTASEEGPRRRLSIVPARRKEVPVAKMEEPDDLYDELRRTQVELDHAVEQLALLHSADPFREGDDKIARKMNELRQDVRQWSQNFYHEARKSGWERMINALKGTPEEESPFREVTSDFAIYLKDGRGPTLLVQGLIWKILVDSVFDCFLWLGGPCQSTRPSGPQYQPNVPQNHCPLSDHFRILDQAGKNSMKNTTLEKSYHLWRAQSARLFVNGPDFHQVCVNQNVVVMAKHISLRLKKYTNKKNGAGNGRPSQATDQLETIVRSAIAFDQMLWQQKAKFTFCPPASLPQNGKKTSKYDPHWMTTELSDAQEAVLIGQERKVALFSVPALLKQGNSEGDNYSESVVLCKAYVDCLGVGS